MINFHLKKKERKRSSSTKIIVFATDFKEKKADLAIKGKIDEVMKLLMDEMKIEVPLPKDSVEIVSESSFPLEKFKRRRICK